MDSLIVRIAISALVYAFGIAVCWSFLRHEWKVDRKFEIEKAAAEFVVAIASALWPLVILAGIAKLLLMIAYDLGRMISND